jgi:4-amino-4-deoxy-L-arabinose transferase-like glycosyltransferase
VRDAAALPTTGRAASAGARAAAPAGARAALGVLAFAVVVRAAVFPFADNKHGDAPMRALIAERAAHDPGAAATPRTYYQFGPLHPALLAPLVALTGELPRTTRAFSLAAGLLTFLPFLRLSRRLVGETRAELAALGLAASPLAVQAATTAASEALYLLLVVAMLERLTRALDDDAAPLGPFAAAGALAALAAVTRYDAWIALPATVAAAWLFARGPAGPARARRARGLAVFAALAAALPAAWMAWGARATDDPLYFFHYISRDHAQLASAVLARYGAALGRARQLGIWALAFPAAMTPALALAAVAAARARIRGDEGARARGGDGTARSRSDGTARSRGLMAVVLVAGLAPVAVYLAQGLLRLGFEPLPRFALVPGALLLPLAAMAFPATRLPAARAAVPLSGLAFAAAVFVVARVDGAGGGRLWGGAESMGALTRLDAEDRALADYLRAHRAPGERVMIEPLAFADIAIAAAGGVPQVDAVTLIETRAPARTLAETARATGARWLAAHDDDRPSAWTRRLPDWPADALELGRWRIVHR